MGRIIYIPLEEMEQRYTKLFNQEMIAISDMAIWPQNSLTMLGTFDSKLFLDFPNSYAFKAQQIQMICNLFALGEVVDGDTFLVADIFFPGLETIKILSELAGVKVFICAFNHAGRADKNDLVQNLSGYSDLQEQVWHSITDVVFAGSFYHANNIKDHFSINKVIVTGMPFNSDWYDDIIAPIAFDRKNDIVIWPHRPCNEKGFSEFIEIVERNPNVKFVITSGGSADEMLQKLHVDRLENLSYEHSLTKKGYLTILNLSKYYLSTAHQETFGYTLQEAIHYGCKIIAPGRACYPEMVPHTSLYNDIKDFPNYLNDHGLITGSGKDRFNGNGILIKHYIEQLQNGNL